jgi:hypothetical protein
MLDICILRTVHIWVDRFLFGMVVFVAIFWMLRRSKPGTTPQIPEQTRQSADANNNRKISRQPLGDDSSPNKEPFRFKEVSNLNNSGNFVADLENLVGLSVV